MTFTSKKDDKNCAKLTKKSSCNNVLFTKMLTYDKKRFYPIVKLNNSIYNRGIGKYERKHLYSMEGNYAKI